MMDKVLFEKCKRASFIKLPGDDWSRVDGFDPEEQILYVHDEDSGEEYSFDTDDLKDAIFYEIKEIKDV